MRPILPGLAVDMAGAFSSAGSIARSRARPGSAPSVAARSGPGYQRSSSHAPAGLLHRDVDAVDQRLHNPDRPAQAWRPGTAAARLGHFPGRRPGHAHCPAAHRRPTAGSRTDKNSAWMFPPKSCVFPAYHKSMTVPLRLRVLVSRHRSVSTTLPSRGSGTAPPSARARSRSCSCRPGARAAQHLDDLVQVAVRRGLRQPEAAAEPRDIGPYPGTRPGRTARLAP